jgi:hypothetical protein
MYQFYALQCHGCKERIAVPLPILPIEDSNRQEIATVARHGVFVCTRCGLVSAYSNTEVHPYQSETEDPYHGQGYSLFCISPECDGQNCGAPRKIHVVVDLMQGIGRTSDALYPKDWKNDGTATCEKGHQLKWERGLYHLSPSDSPF